MTTPLLLHVFPSFAIGGAQARFLTLANAFGHAYRHAIVAMDGDRSCAARLSTDLDVRFPAITIRKGDTRGNLFRMLSCLRAERPDVLITSNWGSIEWAMANLVAGRPHLHMEDGFGPDERDRQIGRRVWTRRLLLRRSRVMLPSQTLCRIATDIWRLPPRRLHYIPNGIDLARFAMPQARVTSTVPVIGTLAGLRPEKNVGRLIRAFARVRSSGPAHLVVVGDGPERTALEALAKNEGVREDVTFAGYLEDPAPVYAGFDIFALSSDTEQMPISVLEAMAGGLPVAATDVGDVAAMLADENRPYLSPRDDDALAGRLRALIDDPNARRRVGDANRARAERDFDLTTMVDRHAALIEQVRGARPPA